MSILQRLLIIAQVMTSCAFRVEPRVKKKFSERLTFALRNDTVLCLSVCLPVCRSSIYRICIAAKRCVLEEKVTIKFNSHTRMRNQLIPK